MKKRMAKKRVIEVWQYLADYPEIRDKGHLPDHIFAKIRGCVHLCPLCDLFNPVITGAEDCTGCPLGSCDTGSYFERWILARRYDNATRKINAQAIVDAVKAWEI